MEVAIVINEEGEFSPDIGSYLNEEFGSVGVYVLNDPERCVREISASSAEIVIVTEGCEEFHRQDIRGSNPNLFLVAFDIVSEKSKEKHFLSSLKFLKDNRCNLVFSFNTRANRYLIITPEESIYGGSKSFEKSISELFKMIKDRSGLTYDRTNFIPGSNFSIADTSEKFRTVLEYLINQGAYQINNGNGFTPGHFCQRINDYSFLSSQRKANHNNVFKEGMSLVVVRDGQFTCFGKRKQSVGARSQFLMLEKYPDYDCIIHTHNPILKGSEINKVSQKPFQCGSLECGLNTLGGMRDYNGIKATYLKKHGPNIMFKSSHNGIINFLEDNFDLTKKTWNR